MQIRNGLIRSQQAITCVTDVFSTIGSGALRAKYRSCLRSVDSYAESDHGRWEGDMDILVGLHTHIGRGHQMFSRGILGLKERA